MSQIKSYNKVVSSESNVLHFYGTKLNFEKLGSFQIVTGSVSYSFGIEDMMTN